MVVNSHDIQHRAEHGGRMYHFCSGRCREKFVANPGRYLDPRAEAVPVPEGTIYTCPMHPEVRQVGPGSCPICGMVLEPVVVNLDAEPNEELIEMRRRFWIGLMLALPVFVLEMGSHFFGLGRLVDTQLSNWAQMALATPVVLWAGVPFFQRGWQSLINRSLNMFTLIAMGTGAAWAYSMVAVLAPGIFLMRSASLMARSQFISKPQPLSPCWCSWARCWNCARAKAPAAPFVRFWIWRPAPPRRQR